MNAVQSIRQTGYIKLATPAIADLQAIARADRSKGEVVNYLQTQLRDAAIDEYRRYHDGALPAQAALDKLAVRMWVDMKAHFAVFSMDDDNGRAFGDNVARRLVHNKEIEMQSRRASASMTAVRAVLDKSPSLTAISAEAMLVNTEVATRHSNVKVLMGKRQSAEFSELAGHVERMDRAMNSLVTLSALASKSYLAALKDTVAGSQGWLKVARVDNADVARKAMVEAPEDKIGGIQQKQRMRG